MQLLQDAQNLIGPECSFERVHTGFSLGGRDRNKEVRRCKDFTRADQGNVLRLRGDPLTDSASQTGRSSNQHFRTLFHDRSCEFSIVT